MPNQVVHLSNFAKDDKKQVVPLDNDRNRVTIYGVLHKQNNKKS